MQAATMSEVEFYCEVFSFVSSRITEKLQLSASCDANLFGRGVINVSYNFSPLR